MVWLETSFFFLLPITENPFPITQKTENIVDIFSFSFGVGLIKELIENSFELQEEQDQKEFHCLASRNQIVVLKSLLSRL